MNRNLWRILLLHRKHQAFTLTMPIGNAAMLEVGFSGNRRIAENHHVSPIHSEYAALPAPVFDPEGAIAFRFFAL